MSLTIVDKIQEALVSATTVGASATARALVIHMGRRDHDELRVYLKKELLATLAIDAPGAPEKFCGYRICIHNDCFGAIVGPENIMAHE